MLVIYKRDNNTPMHLFSNRKSTNNVWNANNVPGVVSNGGMLDVNQMAHINGIGNVPFSDEGIANLLSMAKLIDAGFRITMDTDKEDAINVYTKDNRIIKFTHSKNGLYFHDTEDRKMTFLNSQYENSLLYSHRQVKEAKVACILKLILK